MQSPPPAVFDDKARITQQENLLVTMTPMVIAPTLQMIVSVAAMTKVSPSIKRAAWILPNKLKQFNDRTP